MLGLQKNAVIGLNLYCGGAGSGAGASPPGGRLRPDKAAAVGEGPAAAAAAAARRAGGGGEAAAPLIGGGAGASPSAAAGLGVARPAPIGAEGPDVIGTLAPARRAPPEGTEPPPPSAAAAAAALLRPEDELDGYEPEAPAKRPAHLAVLDLPGQAGGSLPSTPPPDDRDDMADGLYRQSLELITHYLREQAAGRKDEPRGRDRRALETLRRVGDGIQRNHETAFQGEGGLRRMREAGAPLPPPPSYVLSALPEPNGTPPPPPVPSPRRHAPQAGHPEGGGPEGRVPRRHPRFQRRDDELGPHRDAHLFRRLRGQALEEHQPGGLHRPPGREHHGGPGDHQEGLAGQTERLGRICGILPRGGHGRQRPERAPALRRGGQPGSRLGLSNKMMGGPPPPSPSDAQRLTSHRSRPAPGAGHPSELSLLPPGSFIYEAQRPAAQNWHRQAPSGGPARQEGLGWFGDGY
uniref:MCL1 apoptosis regulator, BCL2 family member n=1 Tax=Ornithorhynchus anatinus TaxID=9258 RepID=A0A6I8NSR7_ORNAN